MTDHASHTSQCEKAASPRAHLRSVKIRFLNPKPDPTKEQTQLDAAQLRFSGQSDLLHFDTKEQQ